MQITELELIDSSRSRSVPVIIYTPKNAQNTLPIVIFNPGYQAQEHLANPNFINEYKQWEYLAKYFTSKGYLFISIQHDILGDTDGLEFLTKSSSQVEARKHLWVRGEENILFVRNELKKKFSNFNFAEFMISGHSNAGDISKFFANNRPEMISSVITFDARRCPISPCTKQKLLMFEATDTSTDIGVIPSEGTQDNPNRMELEWVIIKPKDALHVSYCGDIITENLKQKVYKGIDYFLDS